MSPLWQDEMYEVNLGVEQFKGTITGGVQGTVTEQVVGRKIIKKEKLL
jgi:hypothetical protein